MATSFHCSARRPHLGLKEGSQKIVYRKMGFYPFRGPDAFSTLRNLSRRMAGASPARFTSTSFYLG
jgi:hypothetical protein